MKIVTPLSTKIGLSKLINETKGNETFHFFIILFTISETSCVFFRPSTCITKLQALPKYDLKKDVSSEVIPKTHSLRFKVCNRMVVFKGYLV